MKKKFSKIGRCGERSRKEFEVTGERRENARSHANETARCAKRTGFRKLFNTFVGLILPLGALVILEIVRVKVVLKYIPSTASTSLQVKALLRKAGARTREALVEALGAALDAVTVRDARGFLEHCGYRRVGQLL